MRRRGVLTALAASLAGCGGRAEVAVEGTAGTGTATPGPTETYAPLGRYGVPSTICETDPVDGFTIRGIDDPAFAARWRGREIGRKYHLGSADEGTTTAPLDDGATVVGFATDGVARAYPLTVLFFHEVVNDTADGVPVLVTFCPLCDSGMVAERTVDGRETVFEVSGQLWRPPEEYVRAAEESGTAFGATREKTESSVRRSGNLVLVDRLTGSYWSQVIAQAICGPRAGERLSLLPVAVATWGDWRGEHPDTAVLLPPPYSGVVED